MPLRFSDFYFSAVISWRYDPIQWELFAGIVFVFANEII